MTFDVKERSVSLVMISLDVHYELQIQCALLTLTGNNETCKVTLKAAFLGYLVVKSLNWSLNKTGDIFCSMSINVNLVQATQHLAQFSIQQQISDWSAVTCWCNSGGSPSCYRLQLDFDKATYPDKSTTITANHKRNTTYANEAGLHHSWLWQNTLLIFPCSRTNHSTCFCQEMSLRFI